MDTWIHIGLPKTGTTTLQTLIFPQHSQILYLGKTGEADPIFRNLSRRTGRQFDFARAKAAFSAKIAHARTDECKRVIVLSDEVLTYSRFLAPEIGGERLKKLFPDAHIIFVIRDPIEWLQSMYYFNQTRRRPHALDGFTNWLRTNLGRPSVGSEIGTLEIGRISDIYSTLFGGNNLLVEKYEDFRENPEGFIATICQLMGVDAAESVRKYRVGGQIDKKRNSRITEGEAQYLRSFKLVTEGNFAGYIEVLSGLIERLQSDQRDKAKSLLPKDLAAERVVVEQQLRMVSLFVDRAARRLLRHGGPAVVHIDNVLRDEILRVVKPEYCKVAEKFGVPIHDYFH
jgi:hypothetical protein